MTSTTPRPMQTPDLAGLLGKPARRPRPDPEPSQVDADDAPADDHSQDPPVVEKAPATVAAKPPTPPSPAPAAPATRPKRSAAPRAPESNTTGSVTANTSTAPSGRQYLRTIALYIPRSLHRSLGERADATGTTRTALILTAVNERHHDLPAALNTSTNTTAAGDLFDIPQQRTDKEPSVHTTIRVTDRQLTAIDHLVQQLETNRSALIAAALRLQLN